MILLGNYILHVCLNTENIGKLRFHKYIISTSVNEYYGPGPGLCRCQTDLYLYLIFDDQCFLIINRITKYCITLLTERNDMLYKNYSNWGFQFNFDLNVFWCGMGGSDGGGGGRGVNVEYSLQHFIFTNISVWLDFVSSLK